MRSFFSQILFMLVCLLAAGGCATRPSVVEQPTAMTRTEWLAKLQLRLDHWRSYQARLSIKAESLKGNFTFRTIVLAEPPDHLRLEALSLFGQTSGLLVFNREGSSLWMPSEKVLYTADRPESLIEYFLGIPIPLQILEYGLIGCIPPGQLDNLQFTREDSEWLGYSGEPAGRLFSLWHFSSQPIALKAADVGEGQWKYFISYEPMVELNPLSLPKKVRFVSSEWQMEVTIEQMRNSPVPISDVFNPSFPKSIRRINLDSTN